MEAWIEKTTEYKAFKDATDEELQTRLKLTAVTDLQSEEPSKYTSIWFDDFDGVFDDTFFDSLKRYISVRKLTFSTRFEMVITAGLVNNILSALPNISDVSIFSRIAWQELTHVDLSNVESLYASVSDKISGQFLCGSRLEELKLHCGEYYNITPLEMLTIEKEHLDFSTTPKIRMLQLRHCMNIDYKDLASLSELEELLIDDRSMTSLAWLSEDFHLRKLHAYGQVEDISHINTQKLLKCASLCYNSIQCVESLKELPHLEYVDLYRNPVADVSHIKRPGLTVVHSEQDRELEKVKGIVTGSGLGSIIPDAFGYMKQRDTQDIDKLPPFAKRTIQEWKKLDYTEKLKKTIQIAFERLFTGIARDSNHRFKHYSVSYKRIYIETALMLFPFLSIPKTMREEYAKELTAEFSVTLQDIEYANSWMLTEFERQFYTLIRDYPSVVSDSKRLQAILKDFFPTQKPAANALFFAATLGIADEIDKANQLDNMFLSRFEKKIISEYGINSDIAHDAVNAWCICYGKLRLGKKLTS